MNTPTQEKEYDLDALVEMPKKRLSKFEVLELTSQVIKISFMIFLTLAIIHFLVI